jgi:hypothetical protein
MKIGGTDEAKTKQHIETVGEIGETKSRFAITEKACEFGKAGYSQKSPRKRQTLAIGTTFIPRPSSEKRPARKRISMERRPLGWGMGRVALRGCGMERKASDIWEENPSLQNR